MSDMFGAIPTPKPGHWIGAIWVQDVDPTSATDAEVASAVAAEAANRTAAASAETATRAAAEAAEAAARASADATKENLALVGTLANRPAAASNNKTFYWATDDNGGTMYLSDGTNWIVVSPRATQLLSLERTATPISLTATAMGDITGLNGTVTSRGRPLRVGFGCGLLQSTVAGNGLNAQLMADVGDTGTFTQIGHLVRPVVAANGFNSGGDCVRERPAQAAGTVIRYKVQMALIAAGATTTVTCNALGDTPYLYVEEV